MATSQVAATPTEWDEKGKPVAPSGSGSPTEWDENGNPVAPKPKSFSSPAAAVAAGVSPEQATREEAKAQIAGPSSPIEQAIAKKDESLAALSKLAGYDTAPANAEEARKRVLQTSGRMGALYTIPEMASIPGPGGEGTLVMQALKGAAGGAGIGALQHGAERAWRGELPDLKGTAEAAATGGLFGAVANPVMHIPAVSGFLSRIPMLRRWLPKADTEQEKLGAFMNKGYKPVAAPEPEPEVTFQPHKPSPAIAKSIKFYGGYDPLAESGSAVRVSNPTAMRQARAKLGLSPAETERVAGARSLVLSPEEASSEQTMQAIAKRRASERGMQFAGGMTPREGRSVPRFPTRMAPVEYPGPREIIRFPEEEEPR